jgi:ZIP family zinc transporter
MTAWHAVLWGALGASSLLVGQALSGSLSGSPKATGLLMDFGAGALISAVGFELAPEASFEDVGLGVGLALGAGALTYYLADRAVDGMGGADRQTLDPADAAGSPWAMFIGALLDGVPESFGSARRSRWAARSTRRSSQPCSSRTSPRASRGRPA